MRHHHYLWRAGIRVIVALGLAFSLGSCRPSSSPEVVLYYSIDQPVAEPILLQFEKETGIHIVRVADVEASKTAGLAHRLTAERDNPRADVWWSNEIFYTIELAEQGVLSPYESPVAAAIPPAYKDANHRWAATALRARVIVSHTGAGNAAPVDRLEQLADPRLKGRIAMAQPSFGTTGGQVAALYVLWGDAAADAFFQSLHANGIKLLGGNSNVAQEVGKGTMLAGLTDNDDADDELREGGKLVATLPDQQPNGIGTLTIPCSVGLVSGGPHADAAKKLIDYLASKQTEQALIAAHFAKYSVFDSSQQPVKRMNVDYAQVAHALPRAVLRARRIMETGSAEK